MMYAKWEIFFEGDNTEGFSPEDILRGKGFQAEGIFKYADNKIVGTISDDADLENLDQFNIEIITEAQALELAQSIDSGAKLENGSFRFTPIKL